MDLIDKPAISEPTDTATGVTRARIVGQAMILFADYGYAGVSIRDIVDAVGLTPGAIYHHFSGKRALYDKVVQQALDAVSENLVQEARREGAPEARLRGALISFAHYLFERSPELRMVDRIIFEAGDQGLEFARVINGPRRALADLIRQLAPADPANDIAEHLIAAIYGAAKLRPIRARFRDGDRLRDPKALAESLGDLVLRSLDIRPHRSS